MGDIGGGGGQVAGHGEPRSLPKRAALRLALSGDFLDKEIADGRLPPRYRPYVHHRLSPRVPRKIFIQGNNSW